MQQSTDFLYTYFIQPILLRTGYNPINTMTYALIALSVLYIIYKLMKKSNISLDDYFFATLIAFIAFGSSKRVITDATDVYSFPSPIAELYGYNFFNVSPSIYIFVALLFFLALALDKLLKRRIALPIGIALASIHMLLPILLAKNFFFALIPIFLSALPAFAAYKWKGKLPALVVFSHALDGASTFTAVEFLGYGEQHVLASSIGSSFGYFAFYALKLLLAFLFAYVLETEKLEEFDKRFLYAIAITAGLSPGLRDFLRLLAGV